MPVLPYDGLLERGVGGPLPQRLREPGDGGLELIGEVAFGENEKQGQWQVSYRYKLMTMDEQWQAIAAYSSDLTLSERRSQVLKASYSIRDWWKLGLAAIVEDRPGADMTIDPSLFGTTGRGSLGFQIDTSLKF